jgi:DNA-binding FrmR family transcriptional regulator
MGGRHMSEHIHHHSETKNVLNRLSRAAGHLEAIKKMVEEGRDCGDVLIQLAAVRSAINSIGKIVLADHMEHCIADAIESGDREALDKFNDAIAKFLK